MTDTNHQCTIVDMDNPRLNADSKARMANRTSQTSTK
jgi:hypothetical protein